MGPELWFFFAGLVLGSLMPGFAVIILYRRNENLRKQMRLLMNPGYTADQMEKIFDGKV